MQTICELSPKRNCAPAASDCDSKECLRTNQIKRKEHNGMLEIPRNSLRELKGKLQKEAICYLENERKMLLSQQMDKLREKRFLQKTMEEYNSAQGKHHKLMRQHQHVQQTLTRVKQKETKEQLSRLASFKQKENRLMDRLNGFFKSRMTLSKKKQQRPKTSNNFVLNNPNQQLEKTSVQFHRCSNSKINRSISSHCSSPSMSVRTERMLSVRKQQQQKRLQRYMKKLKRAEERVICLQIDKQHSIRESKNKPTKILTGVRDSKVEQARQKNELKLMRKFQLHKEKINQQRKMQDTFIEEKRSYKYKHYQQVSLRHSRFKQSDMKRILDDVSNLNSRSREVQLRKQRQQKIVTMKKYQMKKYRQFQIKKHKQMEIHNAQLAKLQAKLHNVTLLESSEVLNEHEINSSVRLVKCLTSSDNLTDLFTKKKEDLLSQLNTPKKSNQKKFNIKIR